MVLTGSDTCSESPGSVHEFNDESEYDEQTELKETEEPSLQTLSSSASGSMVSGTVLSSSSIASPSTQYFPPPPCALAESIVAWACASSIGWPDDDVWSMDSELMDSELFQELHSATYCTIASRKTNVLLCV